MFSRHCLDFFGATSNVSTACRSNCIARVGVTVAAFMVAIAAHAQTYTLTTLARFNGTNGAGPEVGITLDSSGNIFGTTYSGGTVNDGTVFKIATGTNILTTIANFTGDDGANPYGPLTLDSNGNLYGTTTSEGLYNDGTVFKITAGTNTLNTIANFNGTNGNRPLAAVTLDGSNNLYGTTFQGGANSNGTVFKIAAGTNILTTLASFTGTNGANPLSGIIFDGSGNLYGTTDNGGASGDGTVFKIAAGTHTLTTIATFTGANGANPYGTLTLDSDGNLYGTTTTGGINNDGTVFKIVAGTNTLTTLVTFNGTNGALPRTGLTLDGSGNLYGTTFQGGTSDDGTVFEFSSATSILTTIATFTGIDGGNPGSLTLDSSGNLYGTTVGGGTNNQGTVFKLTPSGSADAPEPSAQLLLVSGAIGLIAGRRTSRKVIKRGYV